MTIKYDLRGSFFIKQNHTPSISKRIPNNIKKINALFSIWGLYHIQCLFAMKNLTIVWVPGLKKSKLDKKNSIAYLVVKFFDTINMVKLRKILDVEF